MNGPDVEIVHDYGSVLGYNDDALNKYTFRRILDYTDKL